MLSRWLTLIAFLAGTANPQRAAITVASTCRLNGRPEMELTLNCGDGKNSGVVQYWHTPFGDLQHPGFHSELDPVFMHHDGSLVVLNTSAFHSGLYYCLLQHTQGTTLWPYELNVSQNSQKNEANNKHEQHGSCGESRFRRDVGSEVERQAYISDGQFAGAVAASVLLTFVLGFSAGALSRTHVLRCLEVVTTRLRSQQEHQAYAGDHDSEVNMTALPPMYENQVFEMEQVWDNISQNSATMETTISSTTSSPPAKPKRSFRNKQPEEQETTAYLEGCDRMKEEEKRLEEGESVGTWLGVGNNECDGETEQTLGKDGGSLTETDVDECSEEVKEHGEERHEKDGGKGMGEKMEWRQEKGVVEAGKVEDRSTEGVDRRGSEEGEARGNKEKGRDGKGDDDKGWREEKEVDNGGKTREEGETDSSSEDDEAGRKQETKDGVKGGAGGGEQSVPSPPSRGRRSRIIRLYQYDEDGHRYGHLPDPAPDEPLPAPRLRQRSVSLTRLNSIMAAAAAGPLGTMDTGKEERSHFHMEI